MNHTTFESVSYSINGTEITLQFIVTIGLLIANLAVAVFIFYQIKQTSNHFFELNRPWILLRIKRIMEQTGTGRINHFPIYLENSGKLSAKNLVITYEKIGIIKSNENLTFNEIKLLEVYPNYSEKLSNTVYSGNVNMGYKFTIKYEHGKKKFSNVVYLYHSNKYTVRISDIDPKIPPSTLT